MVRTGFQRVKASEEADESAWRSTLYEVRTILIN